MHQVRILLFVVLVSASSNGPEAAVPDGPSHHYTWGARSGRDVHLSREIVTEPAKTLRIISDDYEFRQTPPRYPQPRTITQIIVTDKYTNGNGGEATLKNGGPSANFAVVHLRSQRGHGYNFVIDIYGQ